MKRLLIAAAALAVTTAAAHADTAVSVGTGYKVTVGPAWVDVSRRMPGRTKGVYMFSVDGPRLNRLYFTDGIASGGYIIKPKNKETRTPTYRAGMSPTELVEFVTDTVAALEFLRPEAQEIRPAKYGAADAIRFDIAATTKEGLDVSGTAAIAEVDGKAYVMLYLAPKEHYYDATLAQAEAAFASATLAPAPAKKK